MTSVHSSAVVDQRAKLGDNVSIGPFSVIEADVEIGNDCQIGPNVLVASGTRLGNSVKISKGAVVGTDPQDLKYAGEKTYLEVGDGTVIREFATLNRGTNHSWKTVVGKNCFIMSYSHVAHDCRVGDHVIISNTVQLAGHVAIEDFAIIGGMSAVHQFTRIGAYAFVGGGYRVTRDVPPFVLAMGEPLQYAGVNFVGLSRKGFSKETLAEIKRAYRLIFRSNFTKAEAIQHIRADLQPMPELDRVIAFLQASERGLIKG